MKKWEYLVLSESLQENGKWWEWTDTNKTLKEQSLQSRLAELGHDGWKLVSVTTNQENGTTNLYVYYFRRPLEE